MKIVVALLLALVSLEAPGQTMPNKGYCPSGYDFDNGFCSPRRGARDAMPPIERNRELYCPRGWHLNGFFCYRGEGR